MASFVALLLSLVFAEDWGNHYEHQIGTPLGWIHGYLLEATPVLIRPFDVLMLIALVIGLSRPGARNLVRPMGNCLLLAMGTTAVWFTFGVIRGGDARFASWQTYLILSMVLTSFTVAVNLRQVSDYYRLAKWIIVAGMYKAFMCWLSYFVWARGVVGETGAYITSHDDTIAWVVSILILIVNAVDARSAMVTSRNLLLMLFFTGAIQWNSRRIAWVSLALGLATMYFLFPNGPAKRRVNRTALWSAPLILVYVVVGWGRSSKIFLPLHSISSVSTHEDSSTLARNAENLGLIATANYNNSALGTGWGHPYVYLTTKYDISAGFELWRFVPHNSILGLLAFTGILGFIGFWLVIPTAVFLHARVARLGNSVKMRSAGIIAASALIVCLNQLYGDMGIFSLQVMYAIAITHAMALRLPLEAGAWAPKR